MKYIHYCLLSATCILLAILTSCNDSSDTATTIPIAYVNTTTLLSEYQGTLDALQDIQEQRKKLKKDIDSADANLKMDIQRFQKLEKSNPRQAHMMYELIQTRQKQSAAMRRDYNQQLADEENRISAGVLNQINAFVQDYAKRHGYKMIFGATDEGSIMYGDEDLDITKEVLAELNTSYHGPTAKK